MNVKIYQSNPKPKPKTNNIMAAESPYILSDVGKDDIIVVKAPDRDTTKWAFHVSDKDGELVTKVWVARVESKELVKIVKGVETYKVTGSFAWNNERNLTKPIEWDDNITSIDMEEAQLYGVYDWEEDWRLSNKNIKDLIKVIRTMQG